MKPTKLKVKTLSGKNKSDKAKKPEPEPKVVTPAPQDITSVIDQKIGDLVPQGSRKEIVSRIATVVVSERFSGPIAHPKHLEQYEVICPGAADRIIAMAEKQQQHNNDMEQKIVTSEFSDRTLGMKIGGAVFMLLIACALAAIWLTSNYKIAGVFLATAVIGGIGLFVNGRGNGSN